MFRPEIYAKSALVEDQIICKERIGCDGIEIQLLYELLKDKKKGEYYEVSEVFKLEDFTNHNIRVVHTPILSGSDMLLETMLDVQDIPLLVGVFQIANYFGEYQKKATIVVVHMETYLDKLLDVTESWEKLSRVIKWLLDKFPYTEIAIENVTPLRGITLNELHLSNNFGFDNCLIARRLRTELNTDRVGTCLDTCHAMLAEKYTTCLYKEFGMTPADYTLGRFFKENADVAKLIHLCHFRGNGYGELNHGTPFYLDTYPVMCNILKMYEDNEMTCPITLEVAETDYLECDGYRSTYELIDKYYKTIL